MRDMPAVPVFSPDAGQIRPDSARAHKMRPIVRVLTGLRHGSPTERLPRHRADVLGMAIPTAFPNIDMPSTKLHWGIVGHLHLLLRDDILHRRDKSTGCEERDDPLNEDGAQEEA